MSIQEIIESIKKQIDQAQPGISTAELDEIGDPLIQAVRESQKIPERFKGAHIEWQGWFEFSQFHIFFSDLDAPLSEEPLIYGVDPEDGSVSRY